ncbi:hypothetical protein AB0M38_30710 [Streptomyces sp. NPDC051742]
MKQHPAHSRSDAPADEVAAGTKAIVPHFAPRRRRERQALPVATAARNS